MRYAVLILAMVLPLAAAQEVNPPRDSMDFFVGGGAWLPGIFNEGNQLSVGGLFTAGIETPMFQSHQFRLSAGPGYCSSNNDSYDGITAVMLSAGYRKYPFFRPYAGSRAIEPFIGVSGGGIVVWDSVSDDHADVESRSTGGAMIGAELGTRVKLGESTFFDLAITGEWVPVGGQLAGEAEKDLSGIRILGSLVF
jgi:hypothetical protein